MIKCSDDTVNEEHSLQSRARKRTIKRNKGRENNEIARGVRGGEVRGRPEMTRE